MQQLTMAIAGMNCTGCPANVEQVLADVPGTHVDAVRVGFAMVSYDETKTSPTALAQAIVDAGYTPHLPGTGTVTRPGHAIGGKCCRGREQHRDSGHKS